MKNSRIERLDVAGRDVTRYLRLLLRKEGTNFHRSSEFEIVREIKEKMCYIATNATKEEGSEGEKVRFFLSVVIVIVVRLTSAALS